MRIAFVLPGLHRVTRGAEVAFESVARELAQIDNVQVTLFGSGQTYGDEPYEFRHVSNISRERFEHFPRIPVLRKDYTYEEITFIAKLIRQYNPQDFDITVGCTYPFTNWFLRASGGKHRPAHIYVTQNSDYEIQTNRSEYRYFACDGLVCTNPEYFERNKNIYPSVLIPNGVDLNFFFPGKPDRAKFNLPEGVPLVLMVSALIPSKRVLEGIKAVSQVEGLHLVICGEGPERDNVKALGEQLMPGRFYLLKLPRQQMPDIYRSTDVLLHMSLDEPFGNVYIEALATGLPVVAHMTPVTQWICGSTAILVNAEDRSGVIKGLHRALLLRNTDDILARQKLVKTRFTWESISKQYLQFFEDIRKRRLFHSN